MRKCTCETCGALFERKKVRRFCSKPCYGKSLVGCQHSETTIARMRAARLANNPMRGGHHTEETRAKMRAANNSSHASGESAINWRGGRITDKHGYVHIYAPDHPNAVGNYVAEHRLVMCAALGRPLRDEEEVHHKNEVVDDNRPENLEVMSKGAHARLHRLRGHHRQLPTANQSNVSVPVEATSVGSVPPVFFQA